MTEYENEPIPGLPGIPPANERILWQGSPDWRVLARTAFHVRGVAAYFGLLSAIGLVTALAGGVRGIGDLTGTAATIGVGVAGVALLHLLAWAAARSTIYTLTDRRIVLRIGIALPKCINLPLKMVGTVGLNTRADGNGDIALEITGARKLGFLALWPHARPWHVNSAQPMLRALPEAASIAALIGRACLAEQPDGRLATAEPAPRPQAVPAFGEAIAA